MHSLTSWNSKFDTQDLEDPKNHKKISPRSLIPKNSTAHLSPQESLSPAGFVLSPFLYMVVVGIPQISMERLLVTPPVPWQERMPC